MKSSIFWDITSCSPSKVKRLFGGAYCLPFQVRRLSQAKKQCEDDRQAFQRML
jgi:hypothetical protein